MHIRSALPLVALVVALTACATAVSNPDLADGDATVAGATDEQHSVVDADGVEGAEAARDEVEGVVEAPEPLWWTAETVADGSAFAAADLAGEDVVLWMWAPWCTVCNREAPEVATLLDELPEDVTIVGVAGRDDVGPMQEFIAEHGLEGMTHVVDADGSIWASYGISYQPAWVFVDGDGEASVAAGALGQDGVLAAVDDLFG